MRIARVSFLVLLVLAFAVVAAACSTTDTPAKDSAAHEPGEAGAEAGAEAGGDRVDPGELDAAIARACTLGEPCNDRFASVRVWRDADGAPQVLVHEGSLERCSHPPVTYVSMDGKELLGQANRPVTDEADAQNFADERAKVLEGLTMDGRTYRCP